MQIKPTIEEDLPSPPKFRQDDSFELSQLVTSCVQRIFDSVYSYEANIDNSQQTMQDIFDQCHFYQERNSVLEIEESLSSDDELPHVSAPFLPPKACS